MKKSTALWFQMLILAFSAGALGQTVDFATNIQRGSETVKPYKMDDSGQILQIAPTAQKTGLLIKLPPEVMAHHPKLLGIIDFDGDGREEVFIGWLEIEVNENQLHHFQIYRTSTQPDAIFMREFQIEGGPLSSIEFPIAPKGKKVNAAIAVVMGGAKWSTYYVILPNGKPIVELGRAAWLQLLDLDSDRNYEWILLQWRGSDLRCGYGFFGVGRSADIFRPSDGEFKKIWPPSDWVALEGEIEEEIGRLRFEQRYGRPAPPSVPRVPGGQPVLTAQKAVPWGKTYLVENKFYDVDDDGNNEIVTITDVVSLDNPRPRLSIYKLAGDHFECVAFVDLSSNQPAIGISGIRRLKDRKQIVLTLADAKKCGNDEHKFDEGVMIAGGIDFKGGSLKLSWVNDKIDITLRGTVKDIDGDGEEEMIFSSEGLNQFLPQGPAQKKPLLLKSVKDFLPYSAGK